MLHLLIILFWQYCFFRIMVLQITSEIDFTSFCCKAGAVASSQLFLPQHLGYTDSISITEIDGARLMIAEIGNSSTIVLCGTKWSLLNKQERYITQGIDTYKVIYWIKDSYSCLFSLVVIILSLLLRAHAFLRACLDTETDLLSLGRQQWNCWLLWKSMLNHTQGNRIL